MPDRDTDVDDSWWDQLSIESIETDEGFVFSLGGGDPKQFADTNLNASF